MPEVEQGSGAIRYTMVRPAKEVELCHNAFLSTLKGKELVVIIDGN